MLPAAHRMRRSEDFAAAVRRGVRSGRRSLVVHVLDTASASPALVGFVVSRQVGGSVVRNRVERRLRHVVRAHLQEVPRGARLVIRAAPPAAGATSAQLEADLRGALRGALASAVSRRARGRQ